MEEIRNYLNNIRREFTSKPLSESDVDGNPVTQLQQWLGEAIDSQLLDPFAMVVSTVSEFGNPSSRVVYLRDISNDGLVFYTNYNSAKARDIRNNPNVSMLFHWCELDRQIRISGTAERLSPELSDEYFRNRPRESQLGAWASQQSATVASRDELMKQLEEYAEKFKDFDVPRPEHWGGYLINPGSFEFWQGRPGRLHDRICYRKEEGQWRIFRLSP